jgi:hypothetical protein
MRFLPQALVVALALVVVVQSDAVLAAPVQVEFSGNWHLQYDYTGESPQRMGVPQQTAFVFSVTFDVASPSLWHSDPNNIVTEFGKPTFRAPFLASGPQPLLPLSEPSSVAMLSRMNFYNGPDGASNPSEQTQFYQEHYQRVAFADETKYWFHSIGAAMYPVPADEGSIRQVSSQEFLEALERYVRDGTEFFVGFYAYTYSMGPDDVTTYTGGVGLQGFARITAISETTTIPVPSSFALMLGAIALVPLHKRRPFGGRRVPG